MSERPFPKGKPEPDLSKVKPEGKILKTLLLITMLALATPALAGGLSTPKAQPYQFTDEELTAINAIPFGKFKPTVQQIVAHAKKAMVWITALDQDRHPVMHGTGFFIDDGGGVLTNYHVVEHGKYFEAEIIDSGRKMLDGSVSDSNRLCDLAVLRFPAYKDGWKNITDPDLFFEQLFLATDSSLVQEGDRVIVVGNPEGLRGTAAEGIVSSVRMRGALFQISAPVSEGSSGSPVFNEGGYVIGIATMSAKKGQNLNFAIASNVIYDALELKRGPNDHHIRGSGPSKGLNVIALEQAEQVTPAPSATPNSSNQP
jgi:S1-C subfamily serine protease